MNNEIVNLPVAFIWFIRDAPRIVMKKLRNELARSEPKETEKTLTKAKEQAAKKAKELEEDGAREQASMTMRRTRKQ